jgi:hypothetical protein
MIELGEMVGCALKEIDATVPGGGGDESGQWVEIKEDTGQNQSPLWHGSGLA